MVADTLGIYLLLFLVLGSFIARFLYLSRGKKLKEVIIIIIISIIFLFLVWAIGNLLDRAASTK